MQEQLRAGAAEGLKALLEATPSSLAPPPHLPCLNPSLLEWVNRRTRCARWSAMLVSEKQRALRGSASLFYVGPSEPTFTFVLHVTEPFHILRSSSRLEALEVVTMLRRLAQKEHCAELAHHRLDQTVASRHSAGYQSRALLR